jgi:4-amino-4-deoxy-L-arabinose transferase-like glycosyltransferase
MSSSSKKHLFSAVIIALLLRIGASLFCYPRLLDPQHDYFSFGWETGRIAASLALGHGYSAPFYGGTEATAWVPPLFPFLLSLVFQLLGVYTKASAIAILSLNSVFSALTCIPIFFIARSFGERSAKLAVWVWALYPYAIHYSATRVWDNCLDALLMAVLFAMALRMRPASRIVVWLVWGALWGVAALTNPALVAVLPLLLGWIYFRHRKDEFPRHFLRPAVAVALMALIVAPWIVRNYRVFHQFIPVRGNFWMEMHYGNNGDLSELIPNWVHPSTNERERQEYNRLGEVRYGLELKQRVLESVHRDPWAFIAMCFRRVLFTWGGYWTWSAKYLQNNPFATSHMLVTMVVSLFAFAGLWLAIKGKNPVATPLVLVLLVFPIPYYLSHANPQYRHPIDPMILALGSYAAATAVGSRERRVRQAYQIRLSVPALEGQPSLTPVVERGTSGDD